VDAVAEFKAEYTETREEFCARHGLNPQLPVVALLAGSRKQEIKDNLPIMLAATKHFKGFQWVIAGAPGIAEEMYRRFDLQGAKVIFSETYPLLTHSYTAMVTSGTATLETALFRVPQVVCYYMKFGKVVSWLRGLVLKVERISLVNLVADFAVVRELVADGMNERELKEELDQLLLDDFYRSRMLREYDEMVLGPLGEAGASEHAATKMLELLRKKG
jgi:lipid-A-disaccharide synthase